MDEAPFDRARRLKQSMLMKRQAKKIARAKQRAAKKMASPEKLKSRALKNAREKLFMKLSILIFSIYDRHMNYNLYY